MKTHKIPVRMCVACREPHPKKELFRIVRDKEGAISFDSTGKAQGRGAYICPKIECLEKAYKTKVLARTLGGEVDETTYAALRRAILRREIGK